jgi:gamma-glutamyl-gamma-aminobutyrate hydrolase PuuD
VVSPTSDTEVDLPVIGLSTYVETASFGGRDRPAALLPQSYVSAIAGAYGCVVLLPPSPRGLVPLLSALDGLVLTGGPDLDPRLYGAAAHKETDRPRKERDAWELALCRGALEMNLPLLAICRGMQVLNVSLGGSLYQHLPEVVGHESHRTAPGSGTRNRVLLDPLSIVGSVLGKETEGLCRHHQAVDRLGDGLRAVGLADDGTVEAVEVAGRPFAVGVQWHPEDDCADDRLFVAFVAAAGAYRGAFGAHTRAPAPRVPPG